MCGESRIRIEAEFRHMSTKISRYTLNKTASKHHVALLAVRVIFILYDGFEIGHKNIVQVSRAPILLFVYIIIQQPCKHRHCEPIDRKLTTLLASFAKPSIRSSDLFDLLLLQPVTTFSRQ